MTSLTRPEIERFRRSWCDCELLLHLVLDTRRETVDTIIVRLEEEDFFAENEAYCETIGYLLSDIKGGFRRKRKLHRCHQVELVLIKYHKQSSD